MPNDEGRHPFEVVGEVTMTVGKPQPAFTREPGEEPQEDRPDFLRAQLETARAELAAEQARRVRAVEAQEAAEYRARQAEVALREFRVQVRDKAIEAAKEENWCRDGLNQALRDLELPEHVTRFRVPLTVTATQTIWVEVEADDDDEAIDQVTSEDVNDALDRNDWDVDDWKKTDWTAIEPVEVQW